MSGEKMVKTCCYTQCLDKEPLDARIEVKTAIPKKGVFNKLKHKLVVNWRSNGEAEFHTECWDEIITISRSRSTKTEPFMTKEEKSMVKLATEAQEQFDSVDQIKSNAKHAAMIIKHAEHLVAFTGAGISTSAGIGDYRGKAGKWTEEDQTATKSAIFEASTSAEEPPKKKRKQDTKAEADDQDSEEEEEDGVPYEKLRPTYTHEALSKLMESGYLKHIISQNGDGLHGLSGIPANQISELHGNVFIEECEKCHKRVNRKFYVMDDVGSQYYEELEDYGETTVIKPKHAEKCDMCGLSHRTGRKCDTKRCNGFMRDTIINFRDLLGEDILEKAKQMSRRYDTMLCLGTTLQVTPASKLVKRTKNRKNLIICNRQGTFVDSQFDKDGRGKGCRVFGDCDFFMREVMSHIYPADELHEWESARLQRMIEYNKQRD